MHFIKFWMAIQNFIVTYLPKLIVAVIIVIVASYLAQKGGRLVERALTRSKADPGVTALLTNLTRWAILGTGIVFALGLFFNVTSLIAALGLVGFAVSFAFQDVLKNLVAGIIILIQHPFNVGESVSLDGFEGTVIAISTRSTEIQCFDGRLVLIPNGNSIGNPIINYSRSPQRRIELPHAPDLCSRSGNHPRHHPGGGQSGGRLPGGTCPHGHLQRGRRIIDWADGLLLGRYNERQDDPLAAKNRAMELDHARAV